MKEISSNLRARAQLVDEFSRIDEPLLRMQLIGSRFADAERLALAAWADALRRARARGLDPRLIFATRKGVSQASAPEVARARAARLAALLPGAAVLDSTCSIGSDALEVAEAGLEVCLTDLDPLLVRCALDNFALAGLSATGWVADALHPPLRSKDHFGAVLCDPDRRVHGARSLDPEHGSPSLGAFIDCWQAHSALCIKLAPGLRIEGIALPAGLPHQWQWVSVAGELKEACLWTGDLAEGAQDGARLATRCAAQEAGTGTSDSWSAVPVEVQALEGPEAERIAWLADADPALLRAGLLGNLAEATGLRPLNSKIAYLGGDEEPSSPWLRSWRVLGCSKLKTRAVKQLLEAHDIGPLTVMKRGHAEPTEVLAKRYRGLGSALGRLAIVRLDHGHRAYLLEERGTLKTSVSG